MRQSLHYCLDPNKTNVIRFRRTILLHVGSGIHLLITRHGPKQSPWFVDVIGFLCQSSYFVTLDSLRWPKRPAGPLIASIHQLNIKTGRHWRASRVQRKCSSTVFFFEYEKQKLSLPFVLLVCSWCQCPTTALKSLSNTCRLSPCFFYGSWNLLERSIPEDTNTLLEFPNITESNQSLESQPKKARSWSAVLPNLIWEYCSGFSVEGQSIDVRTLKEQERPRLPFSWKGPQSCSHCVWASIQWGEHYFL